MNRDFIHTNAAVANRGAEFKPRTQMLAKVTRQSVNGCQVLFDMTSLIFCNASRALNEWLNECRRGEFDSAGVMMSEPNNREIY